ncbi:MAG: polysaccharide pyruvyl transferase family protein [Verrucomicrobiota bacterium]
MKKKLIHLAPFDRNVGDNALNRAIQDMLGSAFEIEPMELVGNPFGVDEFNRMNNAAAVIFGGGGVIHSCSGGGSRKNRLKTGTMWNMDLDAIKALRSKIILYSVGFNKFDGEPDPLVRMGEFFDVLNEKRALVSFRNDQSKERFLEYFPRFSGIEVVPDPGAFCRGRITGTYSDYAIIQIATDRMDFRYPGGLEKFCVLLNKLASMVDCKVILLPHTQADYKIYTEYRSRFDVDDIFPLMQEFQQVDKIMDLYRNARFTISTRGHSQICSIGNHTPTFAISTHPKVMGYMRENGLQEFAYDYHSDQPEICVERFCGFLKNLGTCREKIGDLNRRFDIEIGEFNRKLISFVNGSHEPPSFVSEGEPGEPSRNAVSGDAMTRTSAEKSDDLAIFRSGVKTGVGSFDIRGMPLTKTTGPLGGEGVIRSQTINGDGPPPAMGFVISCDANYFKGIQGCVAAIRKNSSLPVTFLDAGLADDQVNEVKAMVDDYIDIRENLGQVSMADSHLTPAALSSIYCAMSRYAKMIYLDIDALLLGPIDSMLEKVGGEFDIAAVRGNVIGRTKERKSHNLRIELGDQTFALMSAVFPGLDETSISINTGCFAITRACAEVLLEKAQPLYKYLKLFRTGDQSIINLLIAARRLRVCEMPSSFNFMGLTSEVPNGDLAVLENQFNLEISGDSIKLSLNSQQIVVAHFAGRTKPWDGGHQVRSKPGLAWKWFELKTEKSKKEFLWFLDAVSTNKEASFVPVAMRDVGFERTLDLAEYAKAKEWSGSAISLYKKALIKRPQSRAAIRNLFRLSTAQGDFDLARKCHEMPEIGSSDAPELQRPIALYRILAGLGETQESSDIGNMTSIREMARRSGKVRLGLLHREYSPIKGGIEAEALLLSNSGRMSYFDVVRGSFDPGASQFRRACLESLRKGMARLDFLAGVLTGGVPQGQLANVGQINAGNGVFLYLLSARLKARAHNLSIGSLRNLDIMKSDFIEVGNQCDGKSMDVLIISGVMDRVKLLPALSYFVSLVSENGYLVFIDNFADRGELHLCEGLKFVPPNTQVPNYMGISDDGCGNQLQVVHQGVVNGELIFVFQRTSVAQMAVFPPEDIVETFSFIERVSLLEPASHHAATGVFDHEYPIMKYLREDSASRAREAEMICAAIGPAAGTKIIYHIAYFSSVNSGDIALCDSVSKLLEHFFGDYEVRQICISTKIDESIARSLESAAFLVIGGGGIFHSTSGDHRFSQWDIDNEVLSRISVPIVLFAVGLNEFGDFSYYHSEAFKIGMGTLLSKSVFAGFREKRSCEMLVELFPEFADRIRHQPCITSVPLFLDGLCEMVDVRKIRNRRIAVNFAFDRPNLRYGEGFDIALNNIDRLVRALVKGGWDVSIVCHVEEDMLARSFLSDPSVVEFHELWGRSLPYLRSFYSEFSAVIGMRSHSQLIPLGIGVPVIPIISHAKLQWMMDDLGLGEWGVEIGDSEFVEKLVGMVDLLGRKVDGYLEALDRAALEFSLKTFENVDLIRNRIL